MRCVLLHFGAAVPDGFYVPRVCFGLSYFYKFAPNGYAFGINVVLYALTH